MNAALQRAIAHRMANKARFESGKQKPPTRAQARTWLAPIRDALAELRSGEVASYRGYPIIKLRSTDTDFARIDYAINGFVALIRRVTPEIDPAPLERLSRKLANGTLLQMSDIDACAAMLKPIEDRLIKTRRCDLIDAANIEMIHIEVERLGLQEAA